MPNSWLNSQCPFEAIEKALARWSAPTLPGLPAFQGGAAGIFGYDLCHHIERLPRPRIDEFQVPDLAIGFYDWALAFDNFEHESWLISTGMPGNSPTQRRVIATRRIDEVLSLLECKDGNLDSQISCGSPAEIDLKFPLIDHPRLFSNFSRSDYEATIHRAVDYIHAGDCFQVNVAQRLLCPLGDRPAEIFSRLRESNPSPFGGYFDIGDFQVVSASPERFLELSADGRIEARPIKGTMPRSDDLRQDAELSQRLQASRKDRAENIMIVDLLRNDLGRVCKYGSIEVSSLCEIESYETVHHLVSTINGQLRDTKSPVDLLRATFPGGSITGAPKVRAMEIIAELEPTARGPYCGCMGYIGFNGAMDLNILIRTFTMGKGWIQFPVGGGIVADSNPAREYEETMHKAEGMLRALK